MKKFFFMHFVIYATCILQINASCLSFENETVAVGNDYVAFIKSDGSVWNWGKDIIHDPNKLDFGEQRKIEGISGAISLNTSFSRDLYILRSNGTVISYTNGNIKEVKGYSNVKQIFCGENNLVGITEEGTVLVKGEGFYGQFGNTENKFSQVPIEVKGIDGVVDIAIHSTSILALKEDGTVWFWGANYSKYDMNKYGEIDSEFTIKNIPVQISSLNNIVDIECGKFHPTFFARDSEGKIWGWGSNLTGQLINVQNFEENPIEIFSQEKFRDISVGMTSVLAESVDGQIWEWGIYNNKPRTINHLQSPKKIFAGYTKSIAIDENKNFLAWEYTNLNENSDVTDIIVGKNIDVALFDNKNVSVYLNGRNIIFDVDPVINNGRTLVPIRSIAEALNFDVSWDSVSEIVKLENTHKRISLKIGSENIYLDNVRYKMDVSPVILKGRTMVPLRFISEIIGKSVEWEEETKTVLIKG